MHSSVAQNPWVSGAEVGWIDFLFGEKLVRITSPRYRLLTEVALSLVLGTCTYFFLMRNSGDGSQFRAIAWAAMVPLNLLFLRAQFALQKIIYNRFPTRYTLCILLAALCAAFCLFMAFCLPFALARLWTSANVEGVLMDVNDFRLLIFILWACAVLSAKRDLARLNTVSR
jgi:hypothetical protein